MSRASGCTQGHLVFQGADYFAATASGAFGVREPLGQGWRPACPGVNGTEVPARAVNVRAVARIAAEIAVAHEGDDRSLWLAAGFIPTHRSHPLYGKVELVELGRLRCGGTTVRRDTIARTPSVLEPLRLRHGFLEVRLHGRTRLTGRRRLNLPYAEKGDTISVRGRLCRRTDSGVRVIRAGAVHVSPAR